MLMFRLIAHRAYLQASGSVRTQYCKMTERHNGAEWYSSSV